jgi:NAD-dependent deacetylase
MHKAEFPEEARLGGMTARSTRAPRLYVFSGAGLSAESGVATFRSAGGVWSKVRLDEVCNYRTWREHRTAVFRFYNDRLREIEAARPNRAHRTLARWQQTWGSDRVRLITQNVDDLLERGGASDVVHLHGDLKSLRCTDCDHRFAALAPTIDDRAACPQCGLIDGVKPGVVMFYESAPAYATLEQMWAEMSADDLFVAVGTSFEVIQPDRLLPRYRLGRYALNVLVDPSPECTEFFGIVEHQVASVGLDRIEQIVSAAMTHSG